MVRSVAFVRQGLSCLCLRCIIKMARQIAMMYCMHCPVTYAAALAIALLLMRHYLCVETRLMTHSHVMSLLR